jgi:hypothetical protein
MIRSDAILRIFSDRTGRDRRRGRPRFALAVASVGWLWAVSGKRSDSVYNWVDAEG